MLLFNHFLKVFLLFSLLLSTSLEAGVEKDLKKFFEKNGGMLNASSAKALKMQQAGHYSVGGLSGRSQVRQLDKPLHIEPPYFNAGCGGIDAHFGSFSHISKDNLEKFFKATASNAQSYAFMIALEQLTPIIAGVQKNLKAISDMANTRNLNSCTLASGLGNYARRSLASDNTCSQFNAADGLFSDYEQAREGCTNSSKAKQNYSEKNPLDLSGRETVNITWEVLKNSPAFQISEGRVDRELAEFAMSLVGTVIIRGSEKKQNGKVQHKYETEHKVAKIFDNEFFEVALKAEEGKTAEKYSCQDFSGKCECLKLSEEKWSPKIGWHEKTKAIYESIKNSIKEERELNNEEKLLIARCSFPLRKVIDVITAAEREGKEGPFNNKDIVRQMSFDFLFSYLEDVIRDVRIGVNSLKEQQSSDDAVKDFLHQLADCSEEMFRRRQLEHSGNESRQNIVDKVEHIENQMRNQIHF